MTTGIRTRLWLSPVPQRALARRRPVMLAQHGAKLVLEAREDRLKRLAVDIGRDGGNVRMDVTQATPTTGHRQPRQRRCGRVDVILNAGLMPHRRLLGSD